MELVVIDWNVVFGGKQEHLSRENVPEGMHETTWSTSCPLPNNVSALKCPPETPAKSGENYETLYLPQNTEPSNFWTSWHDVLQNSVHIILIGHEQIRNSNKSKCRKRIWEINTKVLAKKFKQISWGPTFSIVNSPRFGCLVAEGCRAWSVYRLTSTRLLSSHVGFCSSQQIPRPLTVVYSWHVSNIYEQWSLFFLENLKKKKRWILTNALHSSAMTLTTSATFYCLGNLKGKCKSNMNYHKTPSP